MMSRFQKGFSTQPNEVKVEGLPIRGTVPAWLRGTLVRNGPAKYEVGQKGYRHWFDGLAMLHSFSFNGGQVSYANKFLQSPAYKKASETGKISYSEFATDPCRSIFERVMSFFSRGGGSSHNANVNLTKLADRFVAMTETPLTVEFDLQTLETVGLLGYDKQLEGQLTTAHPHYDFGQEAGVNYVLHFSRESKYNVYRVPVGSKEQVLIGSVPVKEPAYMHSFGMTERYIILAEFPLVINPLRLLIRGKPFIENYQWKPEKGTRFLLMDKQNGQIVARHKSDAFFAFHHINAFERDDNLIVDISAYPDAEIVNALYLDRLRSKNGSDIPTAEFRRYHLPLDGSSARYEVLSEEQIELPRINYKRNNARDYRYAYGASSNRGRPYDFLNQLVKVDVQNKTTKTWFEEACYPGEPVFVATPNASAEDDGVILSVVLDGKKGRSFLLILAADSFQEISRAEVPHHVPFGFHGQYFHS